ncbi:DUF2867 domain-containing protein [Rhodoferax sp.]|uniref:DUF2867 domain-containing protein n=1 Tax=Rhodoferax sp. TaxID=50421 RepID=UPI002627D802|nr:DUF2867 domain-containing protein [Rhodoferax sp.]MDD2924442.1 DUF2867 domain-containing protein [Rhodoferax sp.]
MNTTNIARQALPEHSHIASQTPGADFADCYCFADPCPDASAMATYLAVMGRTPRWMDFLMAVRNRVVRLAGLKHLDADQASLSAKPASSYRVGERVGIFSLIHMAEDEVIVCDDDKHLRVQLSVYKHKVQDRPMVSVSTVVHNHNRLGRLYMAVVGPVHQRIVPIMLKQVLHAPSTTHR